MINFMDQERFKTLRLQVIVVSYLAYFMILKMADFWTVGFLVFMGWAPLVFGHYLAKSMAINEWKEKEVTKRREAEVAAEIRKQERIAAEKRGKLNRERTHFIKKFASINNYLDHFSSQEYQDKKSYIKQEITKDLAELVAGRTPSDLKELISSNEDIQLTLYDLSANLKRHSIENVNVIIMTRMLDNK